MKIKCRFCGEKCVKNDFQLNGNQRYKCKVCKKRQQPKYLYKAYEASLNRQIILLTKEGLGIRSTARILQISTTTLLKRIVSIAKSVNQPIISRGRSYEVDEMCT